MFYSLTSFSQLRVNQSALRGGTPAFTNTLSTTFDGVDDYVDCGDNNNLSFGDSVTDSPFSISAWIKVTTGTAFTIVGKYLAYPNGEYRFIKQADGILLIRIISGNSELNRRGRTTNSIDSLVGQWVHVVSTYNGNSDYSGLKIYVDGVRSDVANNGKNTYTAMSNTTYPLIISQFANTNIDEVSIFNTELSQTNITDIYNLGTPTDISAMSGLVSWWRMGDGSTYPTINDEIGSNNGTMTNMSSANFVADVPPTFNTLSTTFDGVDDYVDQGISTTSSTGSVSVWIKPDLTNNRSFIVFDNGGFRNYIIIQSRSDGTLNAQCRVNPTVQWNVVTDNAVLSSTSWTHVVVTHNGTEPKIYIDAVAVAQTFTVSTNKTIWWNTFAPTRIRLGLFNISGYGTSISYWLGTMDEFSIYETELSQAQIAAIYNNGLPTSLTAYNSLVWLRCGDGDTPPTLINHGSSGINGTMINMTIANFVTDVPT